MHRRPAMIGADLPNSPPICTLCPARTHTPTGGKDLFDRPTHRNRHRPHPGHPPCEGDGPRDGRPHQSRARRGQIHPEMASGSDRLERTHNLPGHRGAERQRQGGAAVAGRDRTTNSAATGNAKPVLIRLSIPQVAPPPRPMSRPSRVFPALDEIDGSDPAGSRCTNYEHW